MSLLLFPPYELDSETGELRRDGEPVDLRPQATQILLVLARNPGRLVKREEIRDAVWPDSVVEFDQGINASIRQIRAALGDDASAPRFIETVPRRGYRFVVPLEPAAEARKQAAAAEPDSGDERTPARYVRWITAAVLLVVGVAAAGWLLRGGGAADPRIMVAVVPLQADGGALEEEELARAVTGALLQGLESLDTMSLGTIPWTWRMTYDAGAGTVLDYGRPVHIDLALEGSIRAAGDQLALRLSLVRVRDGVQVWNRRYDAPAGHTELPEMAARDVARAISEQLALQRGPLH